MYLLKALCSTVCSLPLTAVICILSVLMWIHLCFYLFLLWRSKRPPPHILASTDLTSTGIHQKFGCVLCLLTLSKSADSGSAEKSRCGHEAHIPLFPDQDWKEIHVLKCLSPTRESWTVLRFCLQATKGVSQVSQHFFHEGLQWPNLLPLAGFPCQ